VVALKACGTLQSIEARINERPLGAANTIPIFNHFMLKESI
jgi:hypothetical protein